MKGVDGGGWSRNLGAGDDARAGGGSWQIWAWYLGLLDTNPILTKAVTSALLLVIGDVFCQCVVEKVHSLDGKRTAIMTFLGFGLVGPVLHFWYTALGTLVTVGGAAGVGIRLVCDQLVFGPIFIGTFVIALMVLEGKSTLIIAKLKQDWWSMVLVNWKMWIPAQLINFGLVPLKLQVAFANFISIFWNAYLSYKGHVEVTFTAIPAYESTEREECTGL